MRLSLALLLASAPVWAGDRRAPTTGIVLPVLPAAATTGPRLTLPSAAMGSGASLTPNLSLPSSSVGAAASAAAASAKAQAPSAAAQGADAKDDKAKAAAEPALDTAQTIYAVSTERRRDDTAPEDSRSGAPWDGARPLRVIQTAGEAVPFIKTGGLADVVDAVGRGLAKRGHDVTLILPKYGTLGTAGIDFKREGAPLQTRVDNRDQQTTMWVGRHEGVRVVLLENDEFFGRDGPYGSSYSDHGDNDERFIFYSKAVLAAAEALNLKPDVIHAHDWQAGLIPAMLKLQRMNPALSSAKTVLTLHNMAFQGLFPPMSALKAGFSSRDLQYNKLEYWGQFGFLKSGIQYADALTTVSPTYAKQIQSHNDFGMGLEQLLAFRSQELHGILNGVDPKLWNPATDDILPVNYSLEDAAEGKAANKHSLQRMGGLRQGPEKPMLGIVARFSHQKGIDMIIDLIPSLIEKGFQLAITGAGDGDAMDKLKRLKEKYPESIFYNPSFSERFGRMIYAASDFLLMPSRFEPCGLSQLMAQRYGSLPIVAPTGGLMDTVKDVREHQDGDGLFMSQISAQGLADAALAALALYHDSAALARARRAAMLKDSSWDKAILEYEALYRRLAGV